MHEMSLVIPASAYKNFDPTVQRALMEYVLSEMGGDCQPLASADLGAGDQQGLAKLNIAEAKLFLNNCSDKTTSILQEIVNREGNFMASEIAFSVGTEIGSLRGAWAGLTKRVRTVTKDGQASLINWFKEGTDWHGVMASQTVTSMRVALDERR